MDKQQAYDRLIVASRALIAAHDNGMSTDWIAGQVYFWSQNYDHARELEEMNTECMMCDKGQPPRKAVTSVADIPACEQCAQEYQDAEDELGNEDADEM